MNIVLLGPPGAGKGTQAKVLSKELGLKYLGTGDLLRSLVAQGNPKALEAKSFMDKGELVPDKLMVEIISEQLRDLGSGFMLDGFPRTLEQAEILESMLLQLGIQIDHVIYFDLSDSEAEHRLSNRYQCKKCGNIYNTNFGICPQCGGMLERRQDDEPSTIRRRLEVYHAQTTPLLDFYEKRGVLRRVNAQGTVEEVTERIKAALKDDQN
jgi:adenylate kinase